MGVQVVAPFGRDAQALRAAAFVERASGPLFYKTDELRYPLRMEENIP